MVGRIVIAIWCDPIVQLQVLTLVLVMAPNWRLTYNHKYYSDHRINFRLGFLGQFKKINFRLDFFLGQFKSEFLSMFIFNVYNSKSFFKSSQIKFNLRLDKSRIVEFF